MKINIQIAKILALTIILFIPAKTALALSYNLPSWYHQPIVKIAKGDLYYPEWMAGKWKVTSTLIEKNAPFAPDIFTPGFQDNDQYLGKTITFSVRFGREYYIPEKRLFFPNFFDSQKPIVADRAFNGKEIATAYLGENNVLKVEINPDNPNQQITLLKGGIKSISQVTKRGVETPEKNHFIATEVTQQLFKSPSRIYLNQVETTSDYHLVTPENIEATQVTAIYLSPQDPDYFPTSDRPVAIYRYNLDLLKK